LHLDAEPAVLWPIVEEWHRRALPAIGTKSFLESWADFLVAWRRVKVPGGQGAIETAFQGAVANEPPATAVERYG